MAEVTERDRELWDVLIEVWDNYKPQDLGGGDFVSADDAPIREIAAYRESCVAEERAARQTMAVTMQEAIDREVAARLKAEGERDEARDWVRRMHAESQTLTCVYCGHAYPPGTSASGESVLTEHIKVCEKHPMRQAEARLRAVIEAADRLLMWAEACDGGYGLMAALAHYRKVRDDGR